jgi:hypothetical protein
MGKITDRILKPDSLRNKKPRTMMTMAKKETIIDMIAMGVFRRYFRKYNGRARTC